jgi:hypothetical protein
MYQNLMTILFFGYDQVIAYNGYINFHKSATELNVLVAQGDIGQNELTGISKAYSLGSVAVPTIDGTATFYKRVNGQALAVVQLKNSSWWITSRPHS